MPTVQQLKEVLDKLPPECEVVIYPKYSSDDVDGHNRHSFKIENVCLQEPFAMSIKHDSERLNTYFNGVEPKHHEVNRHVAIIF